MRIHRPFYVVGLGCVTLLTPWHVRAHNDHHPDHHHRHLHSDHNVLYDETDLLATLHDHGDHRCATPAPDVHKEITNQLRIQSTFSSTPEQPNDRQRRQRRQLQSHCDELCDQCVEIETRLHLIQGNVTGLGVIFPHPTRTVLERLRGDESIGLEDFSTQGEIVNMFRNNIQVVNAAFAGTPFRFRFASEQTTVSISNDWSNDAIEYRQEMSQAVGSDDLRILDVFVAWSLESSSDEEGTVLGIASLPAAQIEGQGDGLVVRYDVLMGGGLNGNDLGYTLVHEIGVSTCCVHLNEKR